MAIPFVLVGDAPGLPTGLSRIATDVASRLHAEAETLGIDLLHVGAVPEGPLPTAGIATRHAGVPWKTWDFVANTEQWAKYALTSAIMATWPHLTGEERVIVLTVGWDPHRLFSVMEWRDHMTPVGSVEVWAYVPVDGHTRKGGLGIPAEAALRACDRVLAYGPYGAGVLGRVLGRDIEALPHGVDRTVFRPTMTAGERLTVQQTFYGLTRNPDHTYDGREMILGCVATNVARKDFPLFFATVAELRSRGHHLRGWLHTNDEIGHWSVPQLAHDFDLGADALTVTTSMTDRQLACCYASCVATIAIGRGEGFGYPIVESVACGTPCVHVGYAGGADLPIAPLSDFKLYTDGTAAILRPLVSARYARRELETMIEERVAGLCADVSLTDPYDWPALWPRWRDWLAAGLSGDPR